MSTTIAAIIATLIITGMSSAVSHDITVIGGSAASLIFGCVGLVSRNASIHLPFFFGAFAMSVIALISSEANTALFPSTIHVLSCYVAIAGLAVSSPDLSKFCQQVLMATNLLLTFWILRQGFGGGQSLKAWQITNPAGVSNLMACEINMTLPFILNRAHEARGTGRILYVILICLNCVAVVFVMSRNGIGAMLIILSIYAFFNHKRLAIVAVSGIMGTSLSFDNIMRIPLVYQILVKLRLVGFTPVAPRSLIWQVAWQHIVRQPMLGVGPGEQKKALAVIDIYHAHNNFVQVALETGLPSAAIFAFLTLLLLWLPLSTVWRTREYFLPTLPILAYFSYSWTGGPLTLPGSTLLLAICVNEARVAIRSQNLAAQASHLPQRLRSLQNVPRAA